MKKTSTTNQNTSFERIKQVDEKGNEFWSARNLSKVLEYSEYRHFIPVIERAKEACANSGQNISDHFEDLLEMVLIGSGAQRKSENVKLSRYACYLIGLYGELHAKAIHQKKKGQKKASRFLDHIES